MLSTKPSPRYSFSKELTKPKISSFAPLWSGKQKRKTLQQICEFFIYLFWWAWAWALILAWIFIFWRLGFVFALELSLFDTKTYAFFCGFMFKLCLIMRTGWYICVILLTRCFLFNCYYNADWFMAFYLSLWLTHWMFWKDSAVLAGEIVSWRCELEWFKYVSIWICI